MTHLIKYEEKEDKQVGYLGFYCSIYEAYRPVWGIESAELFETKEEAQKYLKKVISDLVLKENENEDIPQTSFLDTSKLEIISLDSIVPDPDFEKGNNLDLNNVPEENKEVVLINRTGKVEGVFLNFLRKEMLSKGRFLCDSRVYRWRYGNKIPKKGVVYYD